MVAPINSILRLSGIGVPPYASRGLSEALQPIDTSDVVRTINGELVDFGFEQFQKFQVTITGNDMRPPACSGVWKGQVVTVDCITALCYQTLGGAPDRPVVDGSEIEEAGFTYYRPRLNMMVMSFGTTTDEWNADVSWTMVLEEI
jgi:hypothetical protein